MQQDLAFSVMNPSAPVARARVPAGRKEEGDEQQQHRPTQDGEHARDGEPGGWRRAIEVACARSCCAWEGPCTMTVIDIVLSS